MIFGEPTNNKIFTGSKGLLEYEINFNGIKAHSSNPEKGINANLNAVKFLYELNEFYNSKIKIERNKVYEIPYTTMNIGIINGGSAINSTSANCKVMIDFRLISEEHSNKIKSKIKELSEKYNSNLIVLQDINPFFDNIEFLEELNTANFITEASFVRTGSKRVILGVGPVTAHEVDEHIEKKSYRKLVEQYKEIICKTCD